MSNEYISKSRKMKNFFSVMESYIITDSRLSDRSVRFMAYISGQSDNWKVRRKQVMDQFGWNKDQFAKVMKELEACGYVQRFHYNSKEAREAGSRLVVHNRPDGNPDFHGEMPEDFFTTIINKQKKPSTADEPSKDNTYQHKRKVSNNSINDQKKNTSKNNEKFSRDNVGEFERPSEEGFEF